MNIGLRYKVQRRRRQQRRRELLAIEPGAALCKAVAGSPLCVVVTPGTLAAHPAAVFLGPQTVIGVGTTKNQAWFDA